MFTQLQHWLIALGIAFSFTFSAPRVQAQEDAHYLMLFSFEGQGNLARDAHTFAAFIRVPDEEDDEDGTLIETTTISWLPASLNVAILRLRPEPGRNLGLHESLRLATDRGATLYAWGPYQIKKELYDRGVAQAGRLNRGEVLYKAVDGRFRPDVATNCFHAISDIVPDVMLDTRGTWGAEVTRMVAEFLSPWYIEPNTTHRALIEQLRLKQYPINYQEMVFTQR